MGMTEIRAIGREELRGLVETDCWLYNRGRRTGRVDGNIGWDTMNDIPLLVTMGENSIYHGPGEYSSEWGTAAFPLTTGDVLKIRGVEYRVELATG